AMHDAPSVLEELRRREPVIRPSPRQSAIQHGSNEAGATRRRPLRREPAYSRTPIGGGEVATLGMSVAKRLIMTTRRSIASLATTATAALALTSAASAFPDKLLQFVTPYPFGGSHV